MKKILLILLTICSINSYSQTSQTIYTNVLHGDTSWLVRTVNSYSLDSVFRKEYQYNDQCDSVLVNDTMRWVCVTVKTDSIEYWYKFRTFTGSVKDSTQLTNIPHKTINNTPVVGSGNINIAGGSGISQQALNDTATAIRTIVNGKSDASHVHAYNTLTGLPTIPTNTNQLTNGAGFLVAADITGKANLASPTFTGTVSGITAAMVGLGNVDNTTDANKPVSSATQTALNAKQNTLSLTTTGTSGAATLIGSTLNIPNYATGGSGGPTFVNLAANFSSTSTTPAAVTGWSFAVTPGKTYRITVIADYQTAATTTGGILGISLTTATGSVRGFASGTVVNTAAATELKIPIRTFSGAGSTLTTTGVTAINSPHYIGLDITFTCTGSGTFNIVWGSEVAASAAQLNANSSLIYQALN